MSTDPSIRVEYALPRDYALIDSTGKISLIGIFDRLFAGSLPAMHRPPPPEPGQRPDPP